MKISLCMIVKNEEDNLKNCLESVKDLVDEINIVDTGSTDRTVEIAQEYTDRIFYFDWIDDFSAARNFSFEKATKDYIMWLDADDIIEEKYHINFKRFKERDKSNADYFMMGYILKKDDENNPAEISYRERILKRSAGFKWVRAIHELLNTSGKKGNIDDVYITHNHLEEDWEGSLLRNESVLKKTFESGKAELMDYYYYGVTLSSLKKYKEAAVYLKYFIEHNNMPDFDGIIAFTQIYKSYIDLGDYENAYKVLVLNDKKVENFSEYHCLLGNFMEDVMKDYSKAIEHYKKALLCKSENDESSHALKYRNRIYYYYEPYHRLGQCFLKLKDYKSARDSFEKALKYRPNDKELTALTEKITKLVNLLP